MTQMGAISMLTMLASGGPSVPVLTQMPLSLRTDAHWPFTANTETEAAKSHSDIHLIGLCANCQFAIYCVPAVITRQCSDYSAQL